jgi:hypothetical protein
MEASARIKTRNSTAFPRGVPVVNDSSSGDNDNVTTEINDSPNAVSTDTNQSLPASRNDIRFSPVEQRRTVARSQLNNGLQGIGKSSGCVDMNDRLQNSEKKASRTSEIKTRSSTDTLLVCPFSDTRVYAIINGDMQFVSLIPTMPFLASIHSVSNRRKGLEVPPQKADIDRFQSRNHGSNRTGRTRKLNSIMKNGSKQSETMTTSEFTKNDRAKALPNLRFREIEKDVSNRCYSQDKATVNQEEENNSIGEHGSDSFDDGLRIKEIDTCATGNTQENYRSRLRARLPRLTKPPKATVKEDMDETTLEIMYTVVFNDLAKCQKNKIRRFSCEPLVEEEIESFMLRTTKAANDRVGYNLVLRSDDSSVEYDIGSSLFPSCLADAESDILWQDYFRRIVNESQKYVNHHRVKVEETTKSLDKRTINCVKRTVAKYLKWNRDVDKRKQHNRESLSSKPGARNIVTRNNIRDRIQNRKRQKRDESLESLYQAVEALLPAEDEKYKGTEKLPFGNGILDSTSNLQQSPLMDSNIIKKVSQLRCIFIRHEEVSWIIQS